jgi:hypothetical protein
MPASRLKVRRFTENLPVDQIRAGKRMSAFAADWTEGNTLIRCNRLIQGRGSMGGALPTGPGNGTVASLKYSGLPEMREKIVSRMAYFVAESMVGVCPLSI